MTSITPLQTNTGRTHFKKGHIPANKGVKRPGVGGVKKGNTPWNKGVKGLQEAWNKGIKWAEMSGENHPMYGKKQKPESVAKMKAKLKGRSVWNKGKKTGIRPSSVFKKGEHVGENNINWKGGVTPIHNQIRSSIEGRLWIQSVFARDGYTCQKTGVKGGKLTAHHILNFSSNPELRFAIDNGITLSIESHKEFHKIYGKTNNTREQLVEFLKSK
jgi:hypothetical protein